MRRMIPKELAETSNNDLLEALSIRVIDRPFPGVVSRSTWGPAGEAIEATR